MSFKIITDSCCDLSAEMAAKLDIHIVPLSVLFDGQHFEDGQIPYKEFYDGLRAGKTASTSAVNPDTWGSAMKPYLDQGQDVLVLAFSSGLSTTYQSAVIAADELREKYPQRKILALDTLCASLGQGLLVYYAAGLRDQGKSIEETAQWVQDNRLNIAHWVTVDDLMHLKRGGRISATTAVMGTMLSIKPIIHVDDEGKLINVGKSRGRKTALNYVADKLGETGLPGKNDVVFLSHSDCIDDANQVARLVKEKYGVKEVVINYIGDVIGSHTGPGTIALFFLADHR